MKILKIEWKHIQVGGETCERCYDTGENLANEIKRLKRSLEPKGIAIEYIETALDETGASVSNTIFFNDVPIEDILEIKVSDNYCESCSDLIGKETYCRIVEYDGVEYDEIPAKAIRHAVYKVLGIEKPIIKKSKKSCCGSERNCCN